MDAPTVKISLNSGNNLANVESDVVVYASDYSRYGIDSTATSILLHARVEIVDKATGKVVAKSGDDAFSLAQNHNAKLHFSALAQNVNLWSPTSPNLYEAIFYLEKGSDLIDEYSENIGFRSFQLSNGRFFINGDQVFIKSVNYEVDFPNVGASAAT